MPKDPIVVSILAAQLASKRGFGGEVVLVSDGASPGSAATFSLWKGATGGNAAGTEVIGQAYSIAANSAFDWYGIMRFDATDFLVGGAGTATALSIQGEGEIGVSG